MNLVIPDFLYWAILGSAAAAALIAGIRAIRRRRMRLGVVAVVLGTAAVLVRLFSYNMVVVEDDGDGGLRAARAFTIGEPSHDPRWIYAPNPTWISNRSSKTLTLELVGIDNADPSRIAPGAVSVDERIDFIGPNLPRDAPRMSLWLRW
jgi:hypothetical protein